MIEIRWYKDGRIRDHDWSAHACPKGERESFTKMPGDSSYFTADSVSIRLVVA